MHAAVVHDYGQPPRCELVDEPTATGEHEEVVDVLAAGLHPRVRSQAAGTHYTSTDELPLIPGVDGVGRRADGSLTYFALAGTTHGSMAERTVIDIRRCLPLPADADPVAVAAAMNPAMSSWTALRRRIRFQPGQSVLVLGATGSAGRLALQTARHLGAARVIAAGRNRTALAALPALGADQVIDIESNPDGLAAELREYAADVDVVLDYLWSAPAERMMAALAGARHDKSQALTWVQIGAVAGPEISVPSALLRAVNVQILGNGQGSLSAANLLAELPSLAHEICSGAFSINAQACTLRDVEQVWADSDSAARIVITP